MTRAHFTVQQLREAGVRVNYARESQICPNPEGEPWAGRIPLSKVVPELAADPRRPPTVEELHRISAAAAAMHDYARQQWLAANPDAEARPRVYEALLGARTRRLKIEKQLRDAPNLSGPSRRISADEFSKWLETRPAGETDAHVVGEAAEIFHVDESTVRRWLREIYPRRIASLS